jgi:hypothetical protein
MLCLSLDYCYEAKRLSRLSSITAHTGGPGFESWPGDWRFSVLYLSLQKNVQMICSISPTNTPTEAG